jgi:predicted phage terminase large subunit-like protein
MWDMLMFGLRLGERPRWLFTSTPKPIKLLRELLAREGKDVVITRGTTFDNAANLAPSFLESIKARYAGTRLGRQELNAEVLLDVQGSLWPRDLLDRANGSWKLPDMKRVVVAIDPSGTKGEEDSGDSVGVVVCGLGEDGFGYVLADKTCKLSPDGWGRVAVNAYHAYKADRIIAERNFGGAMVEHVIRTIDRNVSYREVTASRGKIARAEPVSALYEQGRIRHAASFVELEDQLAAMTSEGYVGDGSPDRADALVWALSELMVRAPAPMVFSVPFMASQTSFVRAFDGDRVTHHTIDAVAEPPPPGQPITQPGESPEAEIERMYDLWRNPEKRPADLCGLHGSGRLLARIRGLEQQLKLKPAELPANPGEVQWSGTYHDPCVGLLHEKPGGWPRT